MLCANKYHDWLLALDTLSCAIASPFALTLSLAASIGWSRILLQLLLQFLSMAEKSCDLENLTSTFTIACGYYGCMDVQKTILIKKICGLHMLADVLSGQLSLSAKY
jgi:hypothetical protein